MDAKILGGIVVLVVIVAVAYFILSSSSHTPSNSNTSTNPSASGTCTTTGGYVSCSSTSYANGVYSINLTQASGNTWYNVSFYMVGNSTSQLQQNGTIITSSGNVAALSNLASGQQVRVTFNTSGITQPGFIFSWYDHSITGTHNTIGTRGLGGIMAKVTWAT